MTHPHTMPAMSADDLQQLAAEVRACTRCALAKERKNAVPGEGLANAEIMFIGEGPGMHEDNQGRPFVGASGQFLTELIGRAGLKREEVFIANVVKCRPPGNRDPLPDEINACRAYLDRQIALVNPKIIVTLGRFSMATYFPGQRISAIHGQAKTLPDGRLVVAMFHPAAALHNAGLRPELEKDFAGLRTMLEERRQTADSRQLTADGGRQTADDGQPTADDGQQTTDDRQQTADDGPSGQLNLFG